ncbi:CapA family protein [Ktedonospora formicarum]|uniref:Capsule synthesis protein CapA domain-containing protein n=1 Tax=Ktedonospora formicarum TaxID=2778364 RepID=A0A8J3MV39_9CHLR|nr:CapA family protein [Ktedonospora formicarum]GHO47531.1 hypothetical protein KSX_56940 [Ktedonospora formicarum]
MRLLFIGDVMLGRLLNDVLTREPPTYPWGDTFSLFQRADTRLCNLECALADRGTLWRATPKVFHFRSDAKNVEVLKVARITATSLANNHTLDFGYEGLFETLDVLRAADIITAGAGRNKTEASTVALWEVQGQKLGLIALTDNQPEWEATEAQAGVWFVPLFLQDERAEELFEVVRKAREEVDLLIVSAHWGPNWGYVPPTNHVAFAHALIDEGADIIFGHSGHVVRGIELYKERPILYCSGDFIDDYAVDPVERNDLSFVFLVEREGQAIRELRLYPTVIQDFQARRAHDPERAKIVTTMQRLCIGLGTPTTWDEQDESLVIRCGV